MDPDALTVCIEHGAFIPCRKRGECYYSQNPYWVKAVRDYQTSTISGLTWEPASEYAQWKITARCKTCGTVLTTVGPRCATCAGPMVPRRHG